MHHEDERLPDKNDFPEIDNYSKYWEEWYRLLGDQLFAISESVSDNGRGSFAKFLGYEPYTGSRATNIDQIVAQAKAQPEKFAAWKAAVRLGGWELECKGH